MPRGYFPRRSIFTTRFQQADLNDPIEYRDGRRRDFWEVTQDRAKCLDPRAISDLRARKEFIQANRFAVSQWGER